MPVLWRLAAMARKVVVSLVDDLDGGTADETVGFGLDGKSYEIDFSSTSGGHAR
jgi:Lsr2